ncbi:MAG: hypothetical protein ACJ0BU_00140 [Candidatus Puniceispirillales bacterium]
MKKLNNLKRKDINGLSGDELVAVIRDLENQLDGMISSRDDYVDEYIQSSKREDFWIKVVVFLVLVIGIVLAVWLSVQVGVGEY